MNQGEQVTQALRTHSIAGMSAGTHGACRCDRRWVPLAEFTQHQADAVMEALAQQ